MRGRAALAVAASLPVWGAAQAQGAARPLETPGQVSDALRGCWQVPEGLRGFERVEVTVRFSLRADGSVQGERRVTAASFPATDRRARDLLARSAVEAVRRCDPFAISAGLGRAVAGRPFAIRLQYRGPRGPGV